MADALDAAIDAATPAAVDAATGTPDKADTTSAVAPKIETPKSAPAVAAGSAAQPTTTGSSVAATTQPNGEDGEPSDADWLNIEKRGRILQNARDKEKARVEAALWEEVGYGKDDYVALKPHLDYLAQDAVGYWKWLGNHLLNEGLIQPSNGNGHGNGHTPAATTSQRPTPDLRAEDGRLAYSAEAVEQLLVHHGQDLMRQFEDRIKPLDATRQELERQKIDVRADQHAKAFVANARENWEGFKDLEPQIHAAMKKDGRVTVESAYNRLLPAYLKDKRTRLESEIRQKTLDEIAAKPKAPTKNVAPSAASVGTHQSRRGSLDSRLDEAAAPFMS